LKLLNPQDFVREYGIRSLVACFSGGKDSLAMTHYIFSETDGLPDLDRYVVFVDTGVMLPISVEYVEKVCAEYGWPLHVLHPKQDFWQLAPKWGCPSPNRRWCCKHLKLEPIWRFMATLPFQRGEAVGMKWCDSKRRSRLPQIMYKRKTKSWGYLPIVSWSDEQVWVYIRRHRLPTPPHYRLGLNETCVCGAFAHWKEWMALKAHFPELYARFVELEKQFLPGRTAFYDKGRRISAKEILAQKTLDEMG